MGRAGRQSPFSRTYILHVYALSLVYSRSIARTRVSGVLSVCGGGWVGGFVIRLTICCRLLSRPWLARTQAGFALVLTRASHVLINKLLKCSNASACAVSRTSPLPARADACMHHCISQQAWGTHGCCTSIFVKIRNSSQNCWTKALRS